MKRKNLASQTKPIKISKRLVYESYQQVARNKGSAGVDGVSLSEFDTDLGKNLYKIWNRLSSGSYFPPAVLEVSIPKRTGGNRPLGIPTVSDRIAQTVIKQLIEPRIECIFHTDSYGYRPNKSAHDALRVCRRRCWDTNWVLDLDIKGFFDNIDHGLMMRAINQVIKERWIRVYLQRWLACDVARNGALLKRVKGTPQGGVISPLLANLYLHFTFDKWMEKYYPSIRFERYADDIVIHTRSKEESDALLTVIRERMTSCKLELHSEKSKIVYCKDKKRTNDYVNTKFDFLGFTFRPRFVSNKRGMYYVGFLPGISNSSATAIRRTIRSWRLQDFVSFSLEDIASYINPRVQGWINYYGLFRKSDLFRVFQNLHFRLLKWIKSKYKIISKKRAVAWYKQALYQQPKLFAHWSYMYTRFE